MRLRLNSRRYPALIKKAHSKTTAAMPTEVPVTRVTTYGIQDIIEITRINGALDSTLSVLTPLSDESGLPLSAAAASKSVSLPSA